MKKIGLSGEKNKIKNYKKKRAIQGVWLFGCHLAEYNFERGYKYVKYVVWFLVQIR